MKQKYAFISYSHRDVKQAKWLHKKLESYRLPTEIHNEFSDSKYLRPVFRDQEDLNTGVLSDELKKHLSNSKYLIVICSPHSAQSMWVSNEIKLFIEWGRLEYIIPFIIDGKPNSNDKYECFPLSLKEYVCLNPDRELLGIDVTEVGKEKAFVRVVSRMLDVCFDELWKRYERERKRRIVTKVIGTVVLTSLFYFFAVPVQIFVTLYDDVHQLPFPANAMLVINGAEYSIENLDTVISVSIPGYFRGRSVPIDFKAEYYIPIAADCSIGYGIQVNKVFYAKRDDTFAYYAGVIHDERGQPVENACVSIEGKSVTTGVDGRFRIVFSSYEQSENKSLTIVKNGFKKIVRTDECPGVNLKFIMHPHEK